MAEEAEGADVVEVALAASFGDSQDVIGIPQAAAAGDGLHTVEAETGSASRAAGAPEGGVGGDGVDATDGAATAIACEDLVAEVARVCTQPPLVDTVVAAEGAAAFRENLKLAPAAKGQAVGSSGKILP
jgi:hypothetical protein